MDNLNLRVGLGVLYPTGSTVSPQFYTSWGMVISFDNQCVVLGRNLNRDQLLDGESVFVLIRPELICAECGDVEARLKDHVYESVTPDMS